MSSSLGLFHPLVADWFRRTVGRPTEIQERAWPEIGRGSHVLATAPTGCGKTLAAFLWGLDRLATGIWPGGTPRILYVSPLKALNADVRRNLLGPLAGIRETFETAGAAPPEIRVATRSGDTTPKERRAMSRHPPEILITTPESLNLLVTSGSGRLLLGGIRLLVLDEIHAVVGTRRGTHLATAVERLVPLAGEFQRVALSATVRPLEGVARFVGGYQLAPDADDTGSEPYRPRPVAIVRATSRKPIDLVVSVPAPSGVATPGASSGDARWRALVSAISQRIASNRSTLIFTNSRRMAEKATRLLNDDAPGSDPRVWAHHGSLSREVRSVVEERFKEGRLRAIVATSSLELGIDIGDLDEVVLLQSPPSVASATQRIGRSGHRVDAASRGRILPLYPRDLLEAAVVARSVLAGEIEALSPVSNPLDVLAQVILAMTAVERWPMDALYDQIRTAEPYRHLPRRHFDLVLEMLAGRYASTRVRALVPRVTIDRVDGTVEGRPGARRLVFVSGGTIPDRGYYHLRIQGSNARLGELDEEFVWERSIGDRFVLGTQSWRIVQISHNDVFVTPVGGAGAMAPFWRAEAVARGSFLAERIARELEWIDGRLRLARHQSPERRARLVAEEVRQRAPLEPEAAAELVAHCELQIATTGSQLPHRHHLLVERVRDARSAEQEHRFILHTEWGGRVNRALALALTAAWDERFERPVEIAHDDSALLVVTTEQLEGDELLNLVPPERIDELVRRRLAATGLFGARFREAAGRALLLPRSDPRRRTPLWLNRQRAKKLLETVAGADDFPITLEAWRTCLEEDLEIEVLAERLGELRDGSIRVTEVSTSSPSPFASGLSWQETNRLMYEDDTPVAPGDAPPDALLRDLVLTTGTRPRIAHAIVAALEAKLHRTAPGYAPRPGRELVAFLADRIAVPEGEWDLLLAAVARDHGGERSEIEASVGTRIVRLDHRAGGARLLVARERLDFVGPELAPDWLVPGAGPGVGPSLDPIVLGEWLASYGPMTAMEVSTRLGVDEERLTPALESLAAEGRLVVDRLRQECDEVEVCDAENFDRLLRLSRRAARPNLEARPLTDLPRFLALQQGLALGRPAADGRLEHPVAGSPDELEAALESLLGFAAPAETWEREILPARLASYQPAWLDALLAQTDLVWLGTAEGELTFLPAGELVLWPGSRAGRGEETVVPVDGGRFSVLELADRHGRSVGEIVDALWQLAWAGLVTSDTFEPVRRGRGAPTPPARPASRRRLRRRLDHPGTWLALPLSAPPEDPIAGEERRRDRVRLLLDRYGVLFRELLRRERSGFRWGDLFRTLRLMELSGEVVAGHFFTGIPGLQFASARAIRQLREGLPDDAIFWIEATDPASPCGLRLEALPGLPDRRTGTHLVWQGDRLVLVSRRRGRRLEIAVPPEHPALPLYLDWIAVALTRDVAAETSVQVDTVNGRGAESSPYRPAFEARFSVTGAGGSIRLWRRYGR